MGYYCCLVGTCQGCCKISYIAKDNPQQQEINPLNISIVCCWETLTRILYSTVLGISLIGYPFLQQKICVYRCPLNNTGLNCTYTQIFFNRMRVKNIVYAVYETQGQLTFTVSRFCRTSCRTCVWEDFGIPGVLEPIPGIYQQTTVFKFCAYPVIIIS